MEDGIFFNQSKYIKEMLKKFGLEDSKPTKTPMSTEIKLTKDDESDSVDSSKYRALAISTTEAEYVSAGKACQQAQWMKQALIDYSIHLDDVPIISSEDLPAHWRTSAPPRSEDCHTTAAKRIKKGL
ncbi:hypothetical protein Tco_0939057 [Tanacetum coccineum]|uniref:Retrovirus-related Pol polyprotein from transposon TNT 1-94 n=1 Tax=Tanacetum coccineum TaxID=301880 RepID=A0ABQ5DJJ3_9ASTR